MITPTKPDTDSDDEFGVYGTRQSEELPVYKVNYPTGVKLVVQSATEYMNASTTLNDGNMELAK